MTSQEAFGALCYCVKVTIKGDSAENISFLTDDSLEYLNLSHLSLTSNGLSIEEETIENLLSVLPYQFEAGFNNDGPKKHIIQCVCVCVCGGGGGGRG